MKIIVKLCFVTLLINFTFADDINGERIEFIKSLSMAYNEEIQTGFKPLSESEWNVFFNSIVSIKTKANLPSSCDNSQTIWFPPVGNQGEKGACVAWACIYYAKTFQEAKENNWDLSGCGCSGVYFKVPDTAYQSMIMSPDFVYHLGNHGDDNGISFIDLGKIMKNIGVCSWKKMPYNANNYSDWPSEVAFREAPLYRSKTGAQIVLIDSDSSLKEIKTLLTNGILPVVTIDASCFSNMTDFFWNDENYIPKGYNHATAIVGYDDTYGPYYENNKATYGAFKLVNSGGTDWGKDGFFFISYKAMMNKTKYAYYFEDLIDYDPKLVAVFKYNQESLSDCCINFGINTIDSSEDVKLFYDGIYSKSNNQFPDNFITYDLTEFSNSFCNYGKDIFMQIYDYSSSSNSTIEYFGIEIYDDYSQKPSKVYIASDIPTSTVNSSEMKIYVGLNDTTTIKLNLEKENIDFGEVYVNVKNTDSLKIENFGTELNLTFSNSNTKYFHVPDNRQLYPSESYSIPITFFSSSTGSYNDTLLVFLDKTNELIYKVPVKAVCVTPPQLDFTSSDTDFVLPESDSITQNFTIYNKGEGSLKYAIDISFSNSKATMPINGINEKSFKNIDACTKFDTIRVYNIHSYENQGFTFAGNDIYYIDGSLLYCYDLYENKVSEIAELCNEATGITWDGELLWIGNSDGELFGYTLDGELVNFFKTDINNLNTLTFNGNYFIASTKNENNIIYFEYSGEIITNIENPFSGIISDIGWTYSLPEYPFLCFDSDSKLLYFFKVEEGILTLVNVIKFDEVNACKMKYYQNHIWFVTYTGKLLKIKIPLNDWLICGSMLGTVKCNESNEISLALNTKLINAGNYFANLNISHNDPYKDTIEKTITLTVTEDRSNPSQIDDLIIRKIYSDSIEINWTSVGDNGNDGFCDNYDIRISENEINEDNFYSAIKIGDDFCPKFSGLSEKLIIKDLESLSKYFIAIKSIDEAGNCSPVSNIVSTYTEGAISICSDTVEYKEIYGNKDDKPNYGELIDISGIYFKNKSLNELSDIYLVFDTTGIDFLHTVENRTYFKNQIKLNFDPPLQPGEVRKIENFNTLMLPDCKIDRDLVRIPIYIKNSIGELLSFGLLFFEITGNDKTSPYVYNNNFLKVNGKYLITAKVFDACDSINVSAKIKGLDKNYETATISNLEMRDDGINPDSIQNDRVFTTIFSPETNSNFSVTFNLLDESDNLNRFIDNLYFSSKNIDTDKDILIINTDTTGEYLSSNLNFFRSISNNSYSYDIWDYSFMGKIDTSMLNLFKDKLIIYNQAVEDDFFLDKNLIKYLLDNNGKLFLTGYGINKFLSMNDTSFYNKYFKSKYINNQKVSGLAGIADDEITKNLYLNYNGSVEQVDVENITNAIRFSKSSYANGVKIDNKYKLVLLGFPFYNIQIESQRDEFLLRIINWMKYGDSNIPEVSYIYSLDQNYPNPFNSSTTIRYSLGENCNVEVIVYDITGRMVFYEKMEDQNIGYHKILFNDDGLASGVYLYQLKTCNFNKIKKMLLIK